MSVAEPHRASVLFATDLDRTLIYSTRAARTTEVLVPVERYDERDISFVSRRQIDLLRAVEALAPVVPVTTRTLAQYQRVSLWDTPPRWAVVANGGIIVHDGVVDHDWTASVRTTLARHCHELRAVAAWLARAAAAWIDHVRIADDLFLYALVDRTTLGPGPTEDLAGELVKRGWTLSIQGRKLYAVPAPLLKSTAVREVARRLACTYLIAAGDSLLDQDLLDAADLSLRPAHGELHDRGISADIVTAAGGVAGGEELLAAVLERLRSPHEVGTSSDRYRRTERDEAFPQAGGRVPPVQRAPAARAWPA